VEILHFVQNDGGRDVTKAIALVRLHHEKTMQHGQRTRAAPEFAKRSHDAWLGLIFEADASRCSFSRIKDRR
jgi:hypothetical protein